MKTLSIDLETYSEADLAKTGVYRYAEDPSFEILLFAVAIDNGPVTVYDLAQGEEIPQEIIDALLDPSITKWAFNASFERICLSRFLWDKGLIPRGTYLSPRGWRCSMIWSAYLGFPLSLASVGAALKLDKQKMSEGKDLIRYFCIPCKATKTNNGRVRNLPSDAPDKWDLFKKYNVRDVEVEQQIQKKLSSHPVPDQVWEEYWLDQEINDRGILVDQKMVENAIKLDSLSQENIGKQIQEITGVENPRSVQQLLEWLNRRGVAASSLDKASIKELLKITDDPKTRAVLNLRQQIAKSSLKKYQAMETAACSDGRVRGMFQFYGANRSGRFCLAEGTKILVKTVEGSVLEKPIEEVLADDLVFDGEEWVHHEGVVYSGDKEVITWDGVTATEEHMVFISPDEKVPLILAKEKQLLLWRGNMETIASKGVQG